MKRSAEFLRGAVAALQRKPDSAYTTSVLLAEYQTLLAAAEAREAFPIPDTLPEVPEAREAGEKTTSTLPEVSTGGVRMSGNTTDQPTAAEVIAACEETLEKAKLDLPTFCKKENCLAGRCVVAKAAHERVRATLALIAKWKEGRG